MIVINGVWQFTSAHHWNKSPDMKNNSMQWQNNKIQWNKIYFGLETLCALVALIIYYNLMQQKNDKENKKVNIKRTNLQN